MAKRLQVILQDPDYRQLQRSARARNVSIAEWVRQALKLAQRREPDGDSGRKLELVRMAARQSFPTGDIGQMLAEIERGYGSGVRS